MNKPLTKAHFRGQVVEWVRRTQSIITPHLDDRSMRQQALELLLRAEINRLTEQGQHIVAAECVEMLEEVKRGQWSF